MAIVLGLRFRDVLRSSAGIRRLLLSPVYQFPKYDNLKDPDEVLKDSSERKHQEQLKNKITVNTPMDITSISGVPEEHIKSRLVRIFIPGKNAMQSGTYNTHHWTMEFDNRGSWENPLIGWSSTGDPLSSIDPLKFATKQDAIAFCEKNGWEYFIEEPASPVFKKNDYTANFSWNKRTRLSTK